MKIPLFISTGIVVLLTAVLLLSSVNVITIINLLITILVAPAAMIVIVYYRGIDKAKGVLDKRFSKNKLFPSKLKAGDPCLKKCYFSRHKEKRGKISIFFKLLIGMWGLSTSIIATVVQIGILFGVDKFPNIPHRPLFEVPHEYVIHIPTPATPEGFILWAYIVGIPFATMVLVPLAILKTANLRHVKDDDTKVRIPTYDWDIISGGVGAISFILLFFQDLAVSPISQITILSYGFLDLVVIGIPLVIFCLFYVFDIEPRLKPKIISYLANELKIGVDEKN